MQRIWPEATTTGADVTIHPAKRLYNKYFLLAELALSVVATFVVIRLFISPHEAQLDERLKADAGTIYPAIASVTGSLLGFTITGLAIIVAFPATERLIRLQKSSQYLTIFRQAVCVPARRNTIWVTSSRITEPFWEGDKRVYPR